MVQTHPTERVQQTNLLAQYELLQRLGGGERASVHLARDRVMQQRVAIKLFRDVWSRDPDRIAQLYGLARAAAALDGARIAAVYDHGTAWHAAFITNEYVPGRDLAELLPPDEALPPRRAATIVAQILEALVTTHAAGLVHGDLHPNNVRLRDGSDAIALIDFGTASVFPLSDDDDHGPFRAPELSSAILTPMTDVYAVGALLRAMLPPPGRAGDPSGGRTLADGLRAIATRALAPVPAERYPTAATMRDALLAVTGPLALPLTAMTTAAIAPIPAGQQRQGGTAQRRRYGPLVLAGALVLGGIVGGGLIVREREATPPAAPTALVVAQPTIVPTTIVAAQPSALPSATVAPQSTTAASSAPPPSSAPGNPPTAAGAPVAGAAPANATVAPATTPTSDVAAPTAVAPTAAVVVVPTTVAPTVAAPTVVAPTVAAPTPAPVVEYTGTFGPQELVGAYRRNDGTLYGRQNAALYSVGTGYEAGTLTFSVAEAPTGPLTLVLTGLDDELSGKNRLVVTINGTMIFAGPNTFPNTPMSDHGVGGASRYWGEMAIPVPAELLVAGENTLVLENAAPGGKLGTPYILINSVEFVAPAAK